MSTETENVYTEDVRLPSNMEEIRSLIKISDAVSDEFNKLATENLNPFYNPSEEEVDEVISKKLEENDSDMNVNEFTAMMNRLSVVLQTQEQLREFKVTDEELKLVKENFDELVEGNE